MTYFNHISSLSELKKQYRALTLINHPDRGGNTETMQRINAEFEKLYNVWKNKPAAETIYTGYENDYNEASAREYTEHVYNEYRWKGSRYNGQMFSEIIKLIRAWLKETYPDYKFSVRNDGYRSIRVYLLIADFEIYKPETESKRKEIHTSNKDLTDRAKEVFSNVESYVLSYRYDNSDGMIDYFDTNFYYTISAGSPEHLYKVEIPKSRRTGGKASPGFKRPVGSAHRALKKVLGDASFNRYAFRCGEERTLLGVYRAYCDDELKFYPLDYSSLSQARKRLEKLQSAGIIARIIGNQYYKIEFVGYTPEVEKALSEEDRAADAAQKEWERQQQPASGTQEETPTYGDSEKSQVQEAPAVPSCFSLVDYSEKALALFGNTRAIKDRLKELGGRFNPGLNDGGSKRAGWVFSKRKETELIILLNSVAV